MASLKKRPTQIIEINQTLPEWNALFPQRCQLLSNFPINTLSNKLTGNSNLEKNAQSLFLVWIALALGEKSNQPTFSF